MVKPIVFYDLRRFADVPESEWAFSPNTWRTRLVRIAACRVIPKLIHLPE
jgi:hypothetical protein